MRVLFSSTRGAGHLQPLLPYAHGLVRHGHEVLVASPDSTAAVLKENGLAHAPFDHPGDAVLAPIWKRFREVSADEALTLAIRDIFAGVDARIALPKLRDTVRSWRPDLVVRESAEFGAAVAAAEAGVPNAVVSVHMVGFEEERMSMHVGAPIDELRREVGLPADNGAALRAARTFSAFPASLDVTPDSVRVFRARTSPASDVTAIQRDGAAPFVYISFGTIAGTNPEARAVYRAALDAVADLPVRALLTTGPGLDPAAIGAVPANVDVKAWVPQSEIFPRADAVLCHGGSGTLLGALAAGLPLVVAPMFADQPHNARRVDAFGAGVAVMKPDAPSIRAALERVLNDATMRDAARRIAAEIAALPTIDDAVDELVRIAHVARGS